MNKKMMTSIFIITIVGIVYFLFYFSQFHIANEKTSIQSNLSEWMSRGDGATSKVNIVKVIRLDDTDTSIILFQTKNKELGYAQILKGWNGRFKIERAGHGTNLVSYEHIKTNKGMYGILVGQNPDLKFDHIKIELIHEDYNFTSKVSGNENFVTYKQLPPSLKKTFPAKLTFFDANNKIIKQQ